MQTAEREQGGKAGNRLLMIEKQMKDTVLILEGESVQTLIVARKLKDSGYDVHLLCGYKLSYGYKTKYADKKTVKPEGLTEEQLLKYLINYIKSNAISTIIPMGDDDALIMSKYKSELTQYTRYLMPDLDVFRKGYDKNLLMSFCSKNGYPHPKTIDLNEIDYLSIKEGDIPFPAIIKPNYTSGGRGMTIVKNIDELKEKYPAIKEQYGNCHVQEFIRKGGKQIKVQVFIDPRTGKSYSSVIHKQRYYPIEGGSSCCNETILDNDLSKMCTKLLKEIGWEGFADFDLIEDPANGELKIMEINPRIPACIQSAVLSGLDYATMIADVSLGKNLKEYTYKPGQKLRHIGFEVLWFLSSKERFKTSPNWFRWIDRHLSFQDFSWRDPLPFLYGTFGNILKQLNPEFRKKKAGMQ